MHRDKECSNMESITYGVNLDKDAVEQIKEMLKSNFDTFRQKYITGILIKKLPAADVPRVNKPAGTGGKTSHIAFTTKSRYFFNDILGASFLDSRDGYDEKIQLPIKVDSKYANSREVSEDLEFVNTHTVIWRIPKDSDNQLGMSKTEFNDTVFQRYREDMYPNNYFLIIKCTDYQEQTNYERDLYTILIKEEEDNTEYQLLSKLYRGPGIGIFEEEYPKASIEVHEEKPKLQLSQNKNKGQNIIYYGVPGTGKSFNVDEKFKENLYRATFYEDYSYSDFVGQVAPLLRKEKGKEDRLVYEFVPGDFAKVLRKALEQPGQTHNFIIEELNRANTAAVFGDVFQLLDRENGVSKYKINNEQLAKFIYKDLNLEFINDWLAVDGSKNEIRIPNNLNLIATMNTSDQNIHPLDTAFTRRWDMEYVAVDFGKLEEDLYIEGLNIRWKEFGEYVNNKILSLNLMNSEDKQLGPFFASKDVITDKIKFANKVLVYLWKDVFKHSKEELFNTDIILGIQSLLHTFKNNPFEVFNDEFKSHFLNQTGDIDAE